MTEMEERVVRALATVGERNGGPPYEAYDLIYGDRAADMREGLLEHARAAMAAMRDPTDAMLALHKEMAGNELCWNADGEVLARVHRAMIDAALKETTAS